MSAGPHPRFPVLGEPLALDLIDTVVESGHGEVDLLGSPSDLEAWVAAEGERLPQPDRALGGDDLRAVRMLRARIESAVEYAREGKPPPAAALRALTENQRAAPQYRELAWDGKAVTAPSRRSGDYTTRLVARLAESATDLLTSEAVRSVRQCERHDCRMLFLPAHPHRRWCSTTCGNRVRVARYYERHKAK